MAMKHAPCRSGGAHGHHGAAGFTCAPASETFKLPVRRMLEPISLRFENSREMEAACRQIGAGGRKQVSVTAAPIERPWRPRAPLLQLPLFITYGPPRRTNSSGLNFIAILPATPLLCFKFGFMGNKNRCAYCDYDPGHPNSGGSGVNQIRNDCKKKI